MILSDQPVSRRGALRRMGAAAFGTAVSPALFSLPARPQEARRLDGKPFTDRPVRCIILGAGNRGNTYAAWSRDVPGQMTVVGVAEPIASRQERFARLYNIPPERRFPSWDDALAVPKFADAILITTPDQLHHGPATRGLELGYHVLLEKPIATTWQHCLEITEQHRKHPRIVAVCHVLRYTDYYRKLKEIAESGILGDLVTIEHMEPVGYWHMAHSFVRGNWRNVATSCPMILAKSCHDLDIFRWMAEGRCRRISSFGSLSHFRPDQAPPGSTDRCIDGCPVERLCPYSALKVYMKMENTGWPVTVITEDVSEEGRKKALRDGPYGRCVYRCDNDVVDHQVVAMEFDRAVTGSFTMSAFTVGSRKTRLMGTMGEASGDTRYISVFNFRTGASETIDTRLQESGIASGHGGGDGGLMEAFIKAVQHNDPTLIATSLEVSLESHQMAFKAEQSRTEGTTQEV